MKNTLKQTAILIVTLLILGGCTKDKKFTTGFEGTWELRKTMNGQTGNVTEVPSGNGTRLVFSKGQFKRYLEGKLINEGRYQIYSYTTSITKEMAYKVILNNEDPSSTSTYYSIKNGELLVTGDVYDAPIDYYRKIGD